MIPAGRLNSTWTDQRAWRIPHVQRVHHLRCCSGPSSIPSSCSYVGRQFSSVSPSHMGIHGHGKACRHISLAFIVDNRHSRMLCAGPVRCSQVRGSFTEDVETKDGSVTFSHSQSQRFCSLAFHREINGAQFDYLSTKAPRRRRCAMLSLKHHGWEFLALLHHSRERQKQYPGNIAIFILHDMYIKHSLPKQLTVGINKRVIIELIATNNRVNSLVASTEPPLIIICKPRRIDNLDTLAQPNHVRALPPPRHTMLS